MTNNRCRIEKLAKGAAGDWADIGDILLQSAPGGRVVRTADTAALIAHWTDYYRYLEPNLIYVARNVEDRLAGYLMGCSDSRAAASSLAHHAGFTLFADLHAAYPAHLHINCRPEYRSQGIGGRLIQALSEDLRVQSIGAVHVVTAKAARNVRFYQRNGFQHVAERTLQGRRLLFLGRRL